METYKEGFVDSLQEEGLAMVRIRDINEACAGCIEFVTKKGSVFLVGANWFDCNGIEKKSINHYIKPFLDIAEVRRKKDQLDRKISTLKKVALKTK